MNGRRKAEGTRQGNALGAAVVIALTLVPAPSVLAQSFAQKGFAEARGTAYPQATPADDTQWVGEFLFRYEANLKPASWLSVTGTADLRGDSHDQTAGSWSLDWRDRSEQRPRLSVRRLDAVANRGPVSVRVGKQFVRWGKADVLNPTDRFAPRDFLNVLDSDFLAVTGARAIFGLQSDTVDVVVVPGFTPSRTPLPALRWAPEVTIPAGVRVAAGGRVLPGGPQVGARWNHVGGGFEFSLSGYRGFNHTPSVDASIQLLTYPPIAVVSQFYPRMWMLGGDAALPLSSFTLKGEAAFFGSDDNRVDEYGLYVIQIERQAGEWFFVGGYAGEIVTAARQTASFAPERGLTKAFIGRAGYTIDTNRNLAFEGALRRNLDGNWLRAEYSQASGQHMRFTLQGSWIRGDADDFFGRYRRNSNATATLRYSF